MSQDDFPLPPRFKPSFLLLQQEGFLLQSCLTHGLTALRNAHAGTKGHYYSAFFNLSIGLERVMKAIVVLDHMAMHDRDPPTTAALRGYGHNLKSLFEAIRAIPVSASAHPLSQIVPGTIEYAILEHLSDFASGARYFNLDVLTASTRTRVDPLGRWNEILTSILREDVPAKRKARIAAQSAALAEAFSGHVGTLMHDLDKQLLTFGSAMQTTGLTSTAAPYAVYRVLVILDALKRILDEATDRVMVLDHANGAETPCVPYMREFLDFFWLQHKREILRKTVWP